MPFLPRITRPLIYTAIVSVAALAAGCASSPQPAATAGGTPASGAKLVDTADFLTKAQDQGWAPQVRNGQVLYCKDVTPVGTLLPEKQCLDKAEVQQMMFAEERQREAMQRAAANAGHAGN